MFKNPRGQCLIINVYNINGAVRRWSDLDVKLLSELFRQLYFNVIVYSDMNGDDLGAEVCDSVCRQRQSKSLFHFFSAEFYENSQTVCAIERTYQCPMQYRLFDESRRRGFIDRAGWKESSSLESYVFFLAHHSIILLVDLSRSCLRSI